MLSFLRCLGHVFFLWQQKSNYHVPGLVQGAICDLPLTVKDLPVNVNRAKVQFVHSEARASPASITYRPDSAMDGVCGIRETRAKGWMQTGGVVRLYRQLLYPCQLLHGSVSPCCSPPAPPKGNPSPLPWPSDFSSSGCPPWILCGLGL